MYKNLTRKYNLKTKHCSTCNTPLLSDIIKTNKGKFFVMYECPNGCAESNMYHYVEDETDNLIYYVEEEEDV